jgi:hypothetical protein
MIRLHALNYLNSNMRAAHQELSEEQPSDIFYKKANTLEAKKKELIDELVADDMQRIFSV